MAPVTAPTQDSPQSPRCPAPSSSASARQALVQRRLALVLQLDRARVRGAHEHEAAGSGRRGALDERLERVAAEQRVGGEGVRAQARDRAERAGRLAHQRLRVGARRDRHVAALAVGQHEQPVVGRDRHDLLERVPSGRAEPLEAGELRLDRHAGGPGGDDRRAAVLDHGLRGASAGQPWVVVDSSEPLQRNRPQRRRIGIEPEHDAAAALLYERRKPVGEMPLPPGGQGSRRVFDGTSRP